MGRRRDATLAMVVLSALLGLARRLDAPLSRRGLVLGGVGALVLEALSQRRRHLVRAVWERAWVQALAAVVTLATAAVGLVLLGPVALAALVGGLSTYLVSLLAVSARESLLD